MKSATRRIVASSLVAVGVGGHPIVFAQDTFQWEAGLSYGRQSFEKREGKFNSASADATYFFDELPVRPKDYPLEQAAFVERVGNLSAQYSRQKLTFEDTETSPGSSGGATVLFRRPDTPLVVSAAYYSFRLGKLTTTSPSLSSEQESRGNAYLLSIGAYADKATALTLDWGKTKQKTDFTSSIPGLSGTFRFTSTSIGFSGEHLAQLQEGYDLALSAGASQTKAEEEGAASEKNRDIFFSATFYPTRALALELGVSTNRGDNASAEGETYSAGARMFVTPTFVLGLSFQRSDSKSPNTIDYDFVTLFARVRF